MGELLQHHAGADALKPLDNLADILVGFVLEKHMDMIPGYLPGNDIEFMFNRDLAQDISHADGHRAGQRPFTILGNPDQMHLQVRLRMGPYLVTSQSDTY